MGNILESITNGLASFINLIGIDVLFIISLAVEVLIVLFFLLKSIFSYEAKLNRAFERLNYWLFEKKVVSEENIKDLNLLFKTKAPKRMCYYWQQYILFREGTPSSYLSTENLIEKPLKTSSYASNIKNLSLFTLVWALIVSMLMVVGNNYENFLTGKTTIIALLCPIFVVLLGTIFMVYLRFRKNSTLNSLYQNVSLFGRFMDNACLDLPSYIDYQILFTPQEIENGQPVLREFLDYKARKEKEEFNKAKQEEYGHEEFDFSATGVDGSMVLDRAMKESEIFLKKKEKILLQISQLEASLDARRKNFDNVQKDYQTKIQASKENVERLRVMQEETTNRIESNYYRKQQTQEIGKQEQMEQEFEQQRAKYLLEKNEGEEEIGKLNAELENNKSNVEEAMLSEYKTFFNKFCISAQKVVGQVFDERIKSLKSENDALKDRINELQVKLKDVPQGVYDGSLNDENPQQQDGSYDENGNYVFANGTFYDKEGNFHDEKGDVYSQDGKLLIKAPITSKEKQTINFDDFDSFDFMTDVSQKGDIYGVAENIVNNIDKGESIDIINNFERKDPIEIREESKEQKEVKEEIEEEKPEIKLSNVTLDDLNNEVVEEDNEPPVTEPKIEEVPEKPKKKVGRPRKIVESNVVKSSRKRGRPRKEHIETLPKRSVGRPRKIVENTTVTPKRGRGRPRKNEAINDINKRLFEEQERLNEARKALNQDVQNAVSELNTNVDDKQARREELIKEIENLQKEAQLVIERNQSENRIEEINRKLEQVLAEIKNLNP